MHTYCKPLLRRRRHLETMRAPHLSDLAEGFGEVFLPFALSRKYPNAAREWAYQCVFASHLRSLDPRDPSARERRHHIDEKGVQRGMKQAVRDAGIAKPATPHTLRHYLPFLTMSCNSGTAKFSRQMREAG
jgi:Phage integrase family